MLEFCPLAFFAASSAVSNSNIINVILILLIPLLTGSLFSAVTNLALIRVDLSRLFWGYIYKFGDLEFTTYSLSEYGIDNSVLYPYLRRTDSILYNSITRLVTLFPPRVPKLYVVTRSNVDIKSKMPRQLCSYRLMDAKFPSYIFLFDKPNQITLLQKFFILHELGHANLYVAERIRAFFSTHSRIIISLMGTIALVNINLASICVFGMAVCYMWIVMPKLYSISRKEVEILEEINADQYAILHLTLEEREKFRSLITENPRFFIYTSKNEYIASRRGKRMIDILDARITPIKYFGVARFPQMFYLAMIPFFAGLGFFAHGDIGWFVLINLVFLLGLFITFYVLQSKAQKESSLIEEVMNKRVKLRDIENIFSNKDPFRMRDATDVE